MELKKAAAINRARLETFLKESECSLLKPNIHSGYIIEQENKIISWFEFELLQDKQCWIKKMFIVRDEAMQLPAVFESIVQFIKSQQAKSIYVYSNQLVTDLLLESLRFSVETEEIIDVVPPKDEGTWWTFQVS